MKKILLSFFFIIVLLGTQFPISGQPVVNFTLPDSSCVGAQINITNLTTGGSTFYWNFCSGNANVTPIGNNIGNFGNCLIHSVYTTLVQDSSDCFSFTTNQGVYTGNPTHITRYYHGSSFRNNPVSWTNLVIGTTEAPVEGIQVKKDNGNWYGFENFGTTIHRINFGASLWNNNPTMTDLGITPPFSIAHGLGIIKDDTTWLGFVSDAGQNKLFRLNFGNSLANSPAVQDLGDVGNLMHPSQLVIQQENGTWYILVSNHDDSTITRINFGNSLFNTPIGTNLGNLGGVVSPIGITYLDDCNTSTGYFTVYTVPGFLGKLNFTGGIGGSVTAQLLGDIGTLSSPAGFSQIFRQNDSLFSYIANWNSSSLTRLSFPPCNNSSMPSSTLFTPPSFSYNQPGTYNVRLQVDEGLPDQATLCKTIVIGPDPTVNLGPDQSICPGTSTILDAGPGYSTYLWSTNATTRTITVSTAGTYWVTVTQTGCIASDTVNVSLLPVPIVNLGPDTTVCLGETVTFDAGACTGCTYLWKNVVTDLPVGTGQTYTTGQAGTFMVTVTNTYNCQAMDTVQMTVNSILPVSETISASVNPVCDGSSVTFTAMPVNGGTLPIYQWKVNGINIGLNSNLFTYTPSNNDTVSCLLTSSLTCTTGNPATSNTINMLINSNPVVSFTPCFDTITAINAKPIKLKGGIPLGGTYSGPGVNPITGIFNPAAAGTGTKTITYSYTNVNLCNALANAYIINNPISIVNCGSPITDIRDNRTYQTVQLGSQCWLANNLNYGTIIASSQDQRDNCVFEKYCYNDNPVNCVSQGGLYQWDELMQYDDTPADQGFCPPSWHIPTENEWNTLFANWTNNGFAGSPLKFSGYSGFYALLSGVRHIDKSWDFKGFATFFWSSTSYDDDKAWAHGMNYFDPSVSMYPSSRVNAFSVRCIKD
jgi:uncharacterized protein (TIGR02145 family)